jgi:hypothetical protein
VSEATFLDKYDTEDEWLAKLAARGAKAPTKRTLRKWRARGEIPYRKIGKSLILIPRDFDPADRKRRA